MEPRPFVVGLVRTIVRVEVAGGGAREADVAQHILPRLHQAFAMLIGPGGFDVLLARTIVLARRAHPILVGVGAGPAGTLTRLDDVARDEVAFEEGVMAIVTQFMELLVALIGEDLALRLVRNAWPEEEEK